MAFFCMVMCSALFAQEKVDMVVMLNGDIKKGTVLDMASGDIKFKHVGEELEYNIARKDVNQIQFASGRIELINKLKEPTLASIQSDIIDRKNKIAVLPFSITSNDGAIQSDAFGVQVQNECANILREEISYGLKVQDPMTTNALLAKNDLGAATLATMLPTEIAAILGVEFVAYGATTVINKGATSNATDYTTYKEKNKDRNEKDAKGVVFNSSNSSTTVNYDTKVDFKIFDDQGKNIYTRSRHYPLGMGLVDGYKRGLKFLIKRSPFGSKHK